MSEDQSEGFVALRGPPSPYKKDETAQTRGATELIKTEWKIIDSLLGMVENAKDDTKKAYIYQVMMGHTRVLSTLLKEHGAADQSQDLAKVLSELTKEAKTTAKRLKLR
ncbi:MAG: hypothetical protein NWE96_07685 [Candidatus Bathyarchaeota archaeon]|nr:hypothetical protein [Candidatus Bathyarchaeota archaeon]